MMSNRDCSKFFHPLKCDACDAGWHAIYKRQYEHPNGERYWMNVCVFCASKNSDFEVKS